MDPARSPSSFPRRHTATLAEGDSPSHTATASLPRLSASAAPPTLASSAVTPRSPGTTSGTSLQPLHTRPTPQAAAAVAAAPSVFATYPQPSGVQGEGGASPSPPQQQQQQQQPPLRPATASMELAVVPFSSGRLQLRPHTPGHNSISGDDEEGPRNDGSNGGDNGEGEAGLIDPHAAGLGALAPTIVSTERVCPHCLRPYDLYDDLFDAEGLYYHAGERGGAGGAAANTPRQLPALPAPESAERSPSSQQQEAYRGNATTTSASIAAAAAAASRVNDLHGSRSGATPPRGPHAHHHRHTTLQHERGGSALPPPALAFTAHYFRALPPPAILAAAAAEGTSPLAIEDYHNPSSLDQTHGGGGGAAAEEGTHAYAAVLVGGAQRSALSGMSGALVPARPLALPRTSPGSPLKLMQSEDDDEAGEEARQQQQQQTRALSAGDERRAVLRELEAADMENEELRQTASPTASAYSPNAPGPAPSNGYYRQYFKELRQLGRGTYGGVFLCRHLMCGVNLGDFALKKIPVGDKAGYLQSVLREVRILEEVRRHPNVVEYKHSWVEDAQLADFGPPVRCLFILMEYASAGSLDAYLDKYGTTLSTLAVWYFFLSAVAGTAHLHHKHILHRDLKPQNLLLAESKGRPPRVLVSDFGTAALLDDISYERSGGTGTLEYMAPELFETAASPRGTSELYVNRHTMASDVWSLGMILYYLAFDATLPDRREDGSVILSTPRLASYGRPPEMLRLLEAMLQLDPALRPRCADMLASTRVQAILRTFNQDDWTQWDMREDEQQQQQQQQQQPGRARKGGTAAVAAKTPSPPQASLPARLSTSGRVDIDRSLGAPPPHQRHHITVTATTAPTLQQLRRERPTASADSAGSDAVDVLASSRVVELQSTTALMDLSAATRPASGVVVGNEQPQLPMRGRPAQRLSSTLAAHDVRQPPRGSGGRRPRSPQAGSVSSPGGTPPPSTVDAAVQTDPVVIVDQ